MRFVVRHFALWAVAFLLVTTLGHSPARALQGATNYNAGDQVEYRFGSRPWQRGVVVRTYPSTNQVVVRDPTGYQQAYGMSDVRPAGSTISTRATGADGGPTSTGASARASARYARPPTVASGPWQLGQHVSVVVAGGCCYDGRVVRQGTGEWAGYDMIQFDDGSHQEYAEMRNIRPFGTRGGTPRRGAPARRSGRCQIITIGNKPVCNPGG